MFTKTLKTNIRSDDRILVISQIEGVKAKMNTGLIDTKLFKGGNRLHALKDPQTYMWHMRYENGGLPLPLKQKFTSFPSLYRFVKRYFNRRGLEITRVDDNA